MSERKRPIPPISSSGGTSRERQGSNFSRLRWANPDESGDPFLELDGIILFEGILTHKIFAKRSNFRATSSPPARLLPTRDSHWQTDREVQARRAPSRTKPRHEFPVFIGMPETRSFGPGFFTDLIVDVQAPFCHICACRNGSRNLLE